jgi:hypothetical protein
LIFPPHFGQRRLFNFMTWSVRGRMPMAFLSRESVQLTLAR